MKSITTLALGMLSSAALMTACNTADNCPTCGTTQNGTVVAITTMEIPQASPYGKPFAVWDLVVPDPVNRRLYVTDRSHAAVAVFDTATDQPIGQVKGGFVGSVCCEPDRASNFNELSGPNGVIVTPSTTGGKLGNLWVSDGDATLKVFDLDKDTFPVKHLDGAASQSFGTVRTGLPVLNIDDCMRGANLGNYPNNNPCGDMRADEPSYGEVDPTHKYLIVTNGDGPNGAFVTLVDTLNPTCAGNSCVLAQYFMDGNADGTPCPAADVSGVTNGKVKCRHGSNATNGLGGSIFNPVNKRFLQGVSQVGSNPADGEIMEIDPVTTAVTNRFPLTAASGAPGCQVASLAIGPSQNLLVGCANREGEAFPPSTYIMDVSTAGKGKIIKAIYEVGRVDQVWYNPGDNRFYLAARDLGNGSFLGIINAANNMWLYNAPTGGNAHAVATDPINNHIYIPFSPNARCGRFSAEGCIAVYAAP